jgi:hypothetical protein
MHFSQAPAKGDISTLPAGGHFYFALTFLLESLASRLGERVIFCPAIIFANGPFRADPSVLFELVKRWVESALADLENFS